MGPKNGINLAGRIVEGDSMSILFAAVGIILLPVYALLLASIALFGFIVTAVITVPSARLILDSAELRREKAIIESESLERPKVA